MLSDNIAVHRCHVIVSDSTAMQQDHVMQHEPNKTRPKQPDMQPHNTYTTKVPTDNNYLRCNHLYNVKQYIE